MKPNQDLRDAALDYHEFPVPGKIAIAPTKPMSNQRDLSLAYSPGVAAACEEIVKDPANAFRFTARGNLVAVITNGTAVLGLGNIGPLAAKPVMEGKAVLFKKFAGIDVFDLELNEPDPDRLVEVIAALEPTFGGINLEDIKAPECFEVERKLRERLKIPVFHDDQHGTAIIVGAATLNALEIVGKTIDEIKVVVSGAGAAALACVKLLVELGLPKANLWLTDLAGVVYQGRTELMDPIKAGFAQATDARALGEVIEGADMFLGLSAGGVLKPEMVARMVERPIIFALANPTPEINPDEARAVRPQAIIATGRTDYPNQVNNVLCFPFLFRGALDVGATGISRGMEIACVHAIAQLAREEADDTVASAYRGTALQFGPEYLIPKPFDPRLLVRIAPAVAKAAMDEGIATRPLDSLGAYKDRLRQFVHHSGTLMKPLFAAAREVPAAQKRLAFAEGEDARVLRAVQTLVDENIAIPTLVGRPTVIARRIESEHLRLREGEHYTVVNPESDPRYREYWEEYRRLQARNGMTPSWARLEMRRRTTLIAAMLLRKGEVDGLLCGTISAPRVHLDFIDQVIGRAPGAKVYAAMNALILPGRTVYLVDTHINLDPDAAEVAEITLMAAAKLRELGVKPAVALLSHSNFGTFDDPGARKMREALALIRAADPSLQIDGEMHGDAAFDVDLRTAALPETTLTGSANLLVLPNLSAANIAYNLLKTAAGQNVAIGPVLLGCAAPVCVLTASATVRRIINMSAITVLEAQRRVAATTELDSTGHHA
ncbi:NADP-dependent malic enzyme [Polycyclovorans algicola]|uniref:NADP-dependent malic enzyme n=1 Tax=Polycyclovorans algicola TaxID=616992 RepID=UPI000693FED9|nr:NADP-dependent malic enzyme [Polycyclovorans algicola]